MEQEINVSPAGTGELVAAETEYCGCLKGGGVSMNEKEAIVDLKNSLSLLGWITKMIDKDTEDACAQMVCNDCPFWSIEVKYCIIALVMEHARS